MSPWGGRRVGFLFAFFPANANTEEGGFVLETLTDQTFPAAVARKGFVVVKFYTTWCPDCRRTYAAGEELARRHGETAAFYEVDTDAFSELAQAYGIRGIPTFLVFRDGEEIARLHSRDAKTAQQVTVFIEEALEERRETVDGYA